MTRPKDAQVSRLRRAEEAVTTNLEFNTMLLEQYATGVLHTDWYKGATQQLKKITPQRANVTTVGTMCHPGVLPNGSLRVTLRPGGFTMHNMCHVLAHYITPDSVQLHGAEFAKNYLEVLHRAAGWRARKELRDAFVTHKVKYRSWSPEAKQRAKERAAAHGTPFAPKMKREEQQENLVAMMRELAGLTPNRTERHEDDTDV